MRLLDWVILWLSQLLIVGYGLYATRGTRTTLAFLKAGKSQGWWAVGLSVMATQASAITFLSGPGQAFAEGMGFLQMYFGLPLAMMVIIGLFIPAYEKWNITTAYEFLEARLGPGVRWLTAGLFLTQRGLAAGFTIFAPALVLSVLLQWDIRTTVALCGSAVVLYTVTGGSRAVAETQKFQMAVMMTGLFFALFLLLQQAFPENSDWVQRGRITAFTGRLKAVDPTLNFSEKYTLWSGLIGGFFLALSYFGTDQSQVARYIGSRNAGEARKGLIMNAILKIPMQAVVLLCGVLLYVYYLGHPRPLNFNSRIEKEIWNSKNSNLNHFVTHYQRVSDSLRWAYWEVLGKPESLPLVVRARDSLEKALQSAATSALQGEDVRDTNYIFLRFAVDHFPPGVLGLIVSMLISAAMSSASSELNALAGVTSVDFIQRMSREPFSEKKLLRLSRISTVFWGLYAVAFAMLAGRLGTLIEAVNMLGSLVYGVILGIFLTALSPVRVRGRDVILAALVAESIILFLFFTDKLPFLWLNPLGTLVVVSVSLTLARIFKIQKSAS
ncbi:MAG: sodium:solute symporter [Flavobacteriales bacterium]|nr:sodium:solute symporter [Flavobacteriales bacterium]MCX7650299.1 sodium:solute symporter [Flavobacteriales bacterium]MDW8431933.1 sodium:solute symporter [Flavobacteriales bacterium]